jgi:hypothetical protein
LYVGKWLRQFQNALECELNFIAWRTLPKESESFAYRITNLANTFAAAWMPGDAWKLERQVAPGPQRYGPQIAPEERPQPAPTFLRFAWYHAECCRNGSAHRERGSSSRSCAYGDGSNA